MFVCLWLFWSVERLSVFRLSSPSVWTVYLGKLRLNGNSQSEEATRVSHIHMHHYYDDETHDYDAALLRLVRPVWSGTLAHPVCLPPVTHQLEPDLLCWVTGWGALREGGEHVKQLSLCSLHSHSCVSVPRVFIFMCVDVK